MPKFMVEVTYSPDAIKGLVKETASARKAFLSKAAKKAGGKLDAFYFSLGEYDAILIFDMPDNISVAGVAAAACASGVARTKTTVLLTVEEMDEALAKPNSYRAPGE